MRLVMVAASNPRKSALISKLIIDVYEEGFNQVYIFVHPILCYMIISSQFVNTYTRRITNKMVKLISKIMAVRIIQYI